MFRVCLFRGRLQCRDLCHAEGVWVRIYVRRLKHTSIGPASGIFKIGGMFHACDRQAEQRCWPQAGCEQRACCAPCQACALYTRGQKFEQQGAFVQSTSWDSRLGGMATT